jgi:hypothetical protein
VLARDAGNDTDEARHAWSLRWQSPMTAALTDVIPLAVGIALSPLPIAALLLMLLSERETANGRAFVLGWIGAVGGLATATVIAHVSFSPSHPPAATDAISQPGAAGLAVALALLNLKDATLTVGAGAAISDARLTAGQSILALSVFAAVATTTVTVPFGVAVVAGQRARPTLQRWHAWLDRHGTTVGSGIISLAGVFLVTAGLG